MFSMTEHTNEKLAELATREGIDIRMVSALAGDRTLNAREKVIVDRLQSERGEAFYADLLHTLTHHSFPSRQAKHLWGEITEHRKSLNTILGRDPGVLLAAHDYLTNVTSNLNGVCLIEENKLASIANVATHDGLTGLFDQTTFKIRLKEELERKVRYGGSLSLVMFDVDKFKHINDEFGHAEGDAVIKHLAEILTAQVRKMDVAARYGGDEFAVILPQVEEGAAYIFAERLRQRVEQKTQSSAYTVTISVGVAGCAEGETISSEALLKKTDEQLYNAKKSGRNKVCSDNGQ